MGVKTAAKAFFISLLKVGATMYSFDLPRAE